MGDDVERPDQRIVLVRHAQTAWSLTGQHTGTTDLPLTDEGRARLPIGYGRHLRLGTASVSVLGWKREVRVLEVWNDRSHLGGGP